MKTIFKKILTGITAAAISLSTLAVPAYTEAASAYPWSVRQTTGNYIADSYQEVSAGHVYESVTQERLLDILSSSGNYYIVFGGPGIQSSQTILNTINDQAKANGITKVYHFDPYIDGYQIDITDPNTAFKAVGGASVYALWQRITALLPSGDPIDSYQSDDTLLINFSEGAIKGSYSLNAEDAECADLEEEAAAIAAVFAGGASSVRSDFDFFSKVYNGSATFFNANSGAGPDAQGNRTGEAVTTLFEEADRSGFALHQINFVELLNLLNSPGEHIIFFGSSWCHNTQAIISQVAAKAKAYGHQTIYVYDTTVGNQLEWDAAGNVTKQVSTFNSRNNASASANNISYLYGELAKYLGNFTTENNSKQNNSVVYYPNGDLSGSVTSVAPWAGSLESSNAIRLQLPFLISYNKDKAEPVTKQWLHKNSANDGTYTEYMIEYAWSTNHPNAAKSTRNYDGLTAVEFAQEAVEALDDVLNPSQRTFSLTSGNVTFPSVIEGYEGAPAGHTAVITSTGSKSTGKLTISLNGEGSDAFTLSAAEIADINVGESADFTVTPKSGLNTGVYTATVTVSGDNIQRSFNVSFTVTAPVYGIAFSGIDGGAYTFPATAVGYQPQPPYTVTVDNTGNVATGELELLLTGENADNFKLSASKLESIDANASGSFTVAPISGLAAGEYKATVIISGDHGISEELAVSFTVSAPADNTVTSGNNSNGGTVSENTGTTGTKNSQTPKTGDNSNIIWGVLGLALSAIGIVLVIRRQRLNVKFK